MADKFRLRRRQDNFHTDLITESEAKKLAGYPGDWEKVPEVKPIVHREMEPKTAKAATRKPTPKKAAPAPTPTPTPASASDTTNEG